MPIDIAKETVGKAAEVAEGFWIIATRHHPGGSRRFPEINNRCLVFRLLENGSPVLLVINGVEPRAIAEVKSLEQKAGAAVRYILSPGGGHHVLMPAWVEAFPEASVQVGPDRIPRTAGGKKLLAMPGVSTFDPDSILPQFEGQVEFVSFRGLHGLPDHQSPGEGGSDSLFAMMGMMFTMMFKMKDPIDELWTFHVASKTVIGGENLGWMFPAATHAKLPGMFKGMIKPDAVYVFTDARKVADAKKVTECWKKIVAWPTDAVLTYHDPPGYCFQGDGRGAIEKAARAAGQLPG